MTKVKLTFPVVSFVVYGQPRGFQSGAGKWNKRTALSRRYYDMVVDRAESLGLKVPLYAEEAYPVFLFTTCYFDTHQHCDPDNAHKGIKDALFYKAKGGDKYTYGAYDPPLYDRPNPRCIIYLGGWMVNQLLQKQNVSPELTFYLPDK